MKSNALQRQLEQYCKDTGIKYVYIAEQLGISKSLLSHWKNGRRNLQSKQLEQLKNLIGANV